MWSYNNTNELYHHGVAGMKWGHRKAVLPTANVSQGTKNVAPTVTKMAPKIVPKTKAMPRTKVTPKKKPVTKSKTTAQKIGGFAKWAAQTSARMAQNNRNEAAMQMADQYLHTRSVSSSSFDKFTTNDTAYKLLKYMST